MTDDLVKRYDVYPAYHGVDVEECHVGEFVYYADHADRIEALTAENERMRKELEDIANDYEAGYPLSHDTIKYAARAALKGERHD